MYHENIRVTQKVFFFQVCRQIQLSDRYLVELTSKNNKKKEKKHVECHTKWCTSRFTGCRLSWASRRSTRSICWSSSSGSSSGTRWCSRSARCWNRTGTSDSWHRCWWSRRSSCWTGYIVLVEEAHIIQIRCEFFSDLNRK